MTDLTPRQFAGQMRDLTRRDFGVFVIRAFRELHEEPLLPNWHIWLIAHQLMRVAMGGVRRLMIVMPPRSLKSFIASICLPAWILGHRPGEQIVCVSYGQDLANEFAFETRRLMQTNWYRRLFPRTHIDPRKSSLAAIATTRGGRRRATSINGPLTGLGGNFVIIDDPIKAGDAHSQTARDHAFEWFRNTAISRPNEPRSGKAILIAQRLHMEDLPGQFMAIGGWDVVELPLIEWKHREIEIAPGQFVERTPGHILHPERFDDEVIARLQAEMGERDFEAQYNQRPLPPGGALFKLAWLRRYDELPGPHKIQGHFQSWDTAYDIEEQHDYSVCSTWALSGRNCYLVDIYRARLEFPDLEKAVYAQRKKWNADLVIVERAGSGISLYQNIYHAKLRPWIVPLRPEGSKQDRASQQSPKFERGEIWVPREAPWLKAFEDELASFPHAKHDDQVDSVVQFLAAVDTGNLLRRADAARRR